MPPTPRKRPAPKPKPKPGPGPDPAPELHDIAANLAATVKSHVLDHLAREFGGSAAAGGSYTKPDGYGGSHTKPDSGGGGSHTKPDGYGGTYTKPDSRAAMGRDRINPQPDVTRVSRVGKNVGKNINR